MKEFASYDALGLAELVARKEVSPEELLDAALARAEAAQPTLNCFTALFPEIARAQIAADLPAGPLSGVPYATKDLNVSVRGVPLTNGSASMRGQIASHDSNLVGRYREAGLTLFAQTTSPEHGLTMTTESRLYGETHNPWDPTRTPGGSSGGAAAAVAAGVLPLAQASDGGGSIRIPAACCGLFGMKPSRGRVPLGPGRTEGWQGMSTVHAVSRSVRDNAALLDATHGPEPGSRVIAPPPERPFLAEVERDPGQMRIALWSTAPNGVRPDADAQAGLDATVALLESLGHRVDEDGPKLDGEALSKGTMLMISAHTSAWADLHEEKLGRPLREDEIELVTQRMIELGRSVPMGELVKSDYAFMEAAIRFAEWMDEGHYDAVLMPTLACKPAPLGALSLSPESFEDYGAAVMGFAPWTSFFNAIGAPAMSLPLHWTPADANAPDGLPLGMMFGARVGGEGGLYRLAGQLERAAPWAERRPPTWFGDPD